MVLSSLLAIDTATLIESGQAIWGMAGVLGVNVLVSVVTFFGTRISGTKITKLSDFSVIASQTMTKAKDEFNQAKDVLMAEVKSDIVEPLKEQVLSLKQDNVQLSSMLVSVISLIPMPLEAKKGLVDTVSTINSVSTQAQALLQQSLLTQEQQEAQTVVENNQLSETISKI